MNGHFFVEIYSYIVILSSALVIPRLNQIAPVVLLGFLQEPSSAQVQPLSTSPEMPPYFNEKITFLAGSARLLPPGKKLLEGSAKWLAEHPDARIAIVGLCDPSGSEECRHWLAEKRGKVVRDFLVLRGVRSEQIEAVLGWERSRNTEGCLADNERCEALNRTTRIFVASPAPTLR